MEDLSNLYLTPLFLNDLAAGQRMFSFSSLVDNRHSRTYLLGREFYGKVLGSCQHYRFFFTEFMIRSTREASRNKMATVLGQYQSASSSHCDLGWVMLSYTWGGECVSALLSLDCCSDLCPSARAVTVLVLCPPHFCSMTHGVWDWQLPCCIKALPKFPLVPLAMFWHLALQFKM